MTLKERDPFLAERLDDLPVPELSKSFYEQLRGRLIASTPMGAVGSDQLQSPAVSGRRSWLARRTRRTAVVVAFIALALVGLGGIVSQLRESQAIEVVVGENAYAAVTESDGIIHEVVASWVRSSREYSFAEYWASPKEPTQRRTVETFRGRLYSQLVEGPSGVITFVRYGPDGRPTEPVTASEGPAGDGPPNPTLEPADPLTSYRSMLQAGTPESVREVMLDGTPARELVVRVPLSAGHATATYVVHRDTYHPIQFTVRTITLIGNRPFESLTHQRFLSFETLPRNRDNEALLRWDTSPRPVEFGGSLPPPE